MNEVPRTKWDNVVIVTRNEHIEQAWDGSVIVNNFPDMQSVSLGNKTGKTNVMRTATLVTNSSNPDQCILSYRASEGQTFYLSYFTVSVRLNGPSQNFTYFGTASLESPEGTKLITLMNAGIGISVQPAITLPEPAPIEGGTIIRVVCTPSSNGSYTWQANLGGYEK